MADTTLSNQLFTSREEIRNQIIEYCKSYLELESIDLGKSQFLSFIINVVSVLTSNLMFYSSSTYNEFFLTKAKLPESVLNLSSFLGYNTQEAIYASCNILMTVPLEFTSSSVTINIPEGFKFYAGDNEIEFCTYYSTDITVLNNSQVSIIATESNKVHNLAVNIDTTSATPEFSFILPTRQYQNVIQEFQISSDLKLYQFVDIDVPLDGKVSSMIVKVKDPGGSSWQTYSEFNSLYLMTSTDYGYVSRRTNTGRKLYFGNNLIGIQPLAGSTVQVTTLVTSGEDGNVIAGSITSADRIYATDDLKVKPVNYSVINTSGASGGEDEESIEDIRKNAIDNITALGRLVSENDFKNLNVIIPTSPLRSNSIAILKRSDLRINEIQLYTILEYLSEHVPMRNTYLELSLDTTSLTRLTEINISGTPYYTLFDMTIDSTSNYIAYYDYNLYELDRVPSLVVSYNLINSYNIILNNLNIRKSNDEIIFSTSFISDEIDVLSCTCQMEILSTGQTFNMTIDSTSNSFVYSFSNYTLIPEGEQTYYFTIKNPSLENVCKYSVLCTVRKSLNSFMMSNVTDNDSTSFIVYDVPVILKSYYDSISKKDFELYVLQTMLSTLDFKDYRMMTDFVNLKFTNTYGSMNNMQYNDVTKSSVIDYFQTSIPLSPNTGDRYIVNGNEGGIWQNRKNQIVECYDSTSWQFFTPVLDDIVYVTNSNYKMIYTGQTWIRPIYDIPLQISMEIVKDDSYSISDIQLINNIKTSLIDEFSSSFGPNISLYRSKLIKNIQSVDGVGHCHLKEPESNIFFEYDLTDLTKEELLRYSPEYVYFDEDSISVDIIG